MNPILIYAKNRQSLGGLFAVMEKLEASGHEQIVLTTSDSTVPAYSQAFRDDLPQRFLQLEEAAKYRWAAILSTHFPPDAFARRCPLMIIAHGTGFGIGGAYNEILASDCSVYFSQHPDEYRSLKRRLGDKFPDDRFVPAGAPHTDEFARYVNQKPGERQKMKQKLRLDPELPVILVSSHWTPDSILRSWGPAVLPALEQFTDRFNIVQIAHRVIWDFPAQDTYDPRRKHTRETKEFDSAKLFNDLRTYCKYRTNVHFLPNINSWKALAVADLLIGDYSSIIVEYCALDRPIVFSNRQDRFFDEINYQRYSAACGAADSLEQLASVVEEEWGSPQQRSLARQALAKEFIWNFGNAASTVAGEILKRI